RRYTTAAPPRGVLIPFLLHRAAWGDSSSRAAPVMRRTASVGIAIRSAGALLALALACAPVAPARAGDAGSPCSCGDGVACGEGVGCRAGGGICDWLGGPAANPCSGCGPGFCGQLVTPAGGCASGIETFWFRGDYLRWDRSGVELPPLVTTSPLGVPGPQQGILGLGTTTIAAGDLTIGDGWRHGFALEGGFWIDPHAGFALALDYFNAGRDSYGARVGNDNQFVARPFFDTQLGVQRARILNAPGELNGGVGVSAFDDFQGAGAWLQKCVWHRGNGCTTDGGARVSLLGGYRYYHQDSLVYIREDYEALAGNTFGRPTGELHVAADKFAGRNEFHGLEIGVQGRLQRCRWWCEGLAMVALGGSRRVVFVEGSTINFDPMLGADAEQGALLTSGITNFGRYTDDQAQAIPRFRLGGGCQLTERLSARAGYSVIIWNNVVQAADHLPTGLAVDPRNLPTIAPGGGPEPAFPGIRDRRMVAHGLDFGLELWF
ncbi:MAG TPA: BBP7 family outer membrane beta-barrel protein, partial [Lacipirellulaceae bacterium]|nr:BBP7 family outer membrane beta-barrel protein [Lacipirellulaceae bacterium]